MAVDIKILTGAQLRKTLPDVAHLRISVFRDWPYLYDGSLDYEERYLQRYAQSDAAVIVGAFDGGRLVGAATGEPLSGEFEEFQTPLKAAGYNPDRIFYMAESVLDPTYRGQGIGHRFFDVREAHARALGFAEAMFCAVIRPEDHPARPSAYSPLDTFWEKRGYNKLDGVIVSFPWLDVGKQKETEKPMQVWHRRF